MWFWFIYLFNHLIIYLTNFLFIYYLFNLVTYVFKFLIIQLLIWYNLFIYLIPSTYCEFIEYNVFCLINLWRVAPRTLLSVDQ
jgi:hypothetical protein